MFSVPKKIFVIVLSVTAVATFFGYRWSHWDDYVPDDMYIGSPVYSPDKKYKAIVFSENGGGGISPYCFDYVSVVPASLETARSFKRKFHVYEGSCHSLNYSFTDGKLPRLEHAPLLKWNSATEIEITFNQHQAEIGINKFLFVNQADEGRISVMRRNYQQ